MPDRGEIVMAVHRPDTELLRRQIRSIQDQSLTTWTCRIGIDGADPVIRVLLEELVAGDDRFVIKEYDDNAGVYRHFERLLGALRPDAGWVALSDQDDRWHPTKLERLVAVLGPTVTAVSCQAFVVDRDGRRIGRTDRRAGDVVDLLLRNQMTGSLTVWRRDSVDASLPFPRATDIAIHDHWLAVCAASMGEVRVVDDPLQDYVQHGGNVIGEVRPFRLAERVSEVRRLGGARRFLDYIASERWGWRVAMAEELVARRLLPAPDPAITAIAEHRVRRPVLARLGHGVRTGHLTAPGATGMVVAAGWDRIRRPDRAGR